MRSTNPVRAFIRNRDFFKLPQALETGAEQGMWTFERYQTWMTKRAQWHVPNAEDEAPDQEEATPIANVLSPAPATPRAASQAAPIANPSPETRRPGERIEIEPEAGGLDEVVKRLT